MPLWVRRCLTLACLLAAWLVARPAGASAAPVCDERAATFIAPLPVLDVSDASLSASDAPAADSADCDFGADSDRNYHRKNPHRSSAPSETDLTPLSSALSIAELAPRAYLVPLTWTVVPKGVRSEVDRPPRR